MNPPKTKWGCTKHMKCLNFLVLIKFCFLFCLEYLVCFCLEELELILSFFYYILYFVCFALYFVLMHLAFCCTSRFNSIHLKGFWQNKWYVHFLLDIVMWIRGGSTYGPNQHPPPFWQINHANSAYFRFFFGLYQPHGPLLDLSPPPFLHILDPPLCE